MKEEEDTGMEKNKPYVHIILNSWIPCLQIQNETSSESFNLSLYLYYYYYMCVYV